MTRSRRSYRGGQSDGMAPMMNDLLLNTLLVVVLVLMIVITAIGIPDVSADLLRKYQARVSALRNQVQGLTMDLRAEAAAHQQALQARDDAQHARKAAELERDSAVARADRSEQLADDANRRARLAEAGKRQADAGAARAQSERDMAIDEANKLRPKPVDVVLVIDGTESMDPVLDELASASKSVAEIGSRLSTRFRLGIVVYRTSGSVSTFPLTEITETIDGRPSEGMRALTRFTDAKTKRVNIVAGSNGEIGGKPTGKTQMVSELEGLLSLADIESGLSAGVRMLESRRATGTRQVMIVMGDVGPWESDGEAGSISRADRQSAQRCLASARGFAQSGEDRRILAMFTGKTLQNLRHRGETVEFFRQLAAQAGSNGAYSDDTSKIAASVVDAAVGP